MYETPHYQINLSPVAPKGQDNEDAPVDSYLGYPDPEITGTVYRVWAETAANYWQAVSNPFPSSEEAHAWAMSLNTTWRVEPEDA